MLLQILEDGVLTDSQGRHVDFKNTVVILTSNLGARAIVQQQSAVGFGEGAADDDATIRERVMAEVKAQFKPEFLNRIDEIIVFRKLQTADIEQIARRMLASLTERVKHLGITITFTDEAVAAVAEAGFDPTYGARPLRRAIQSRIEDPLSEEILAGRIKEGDAVACVFEDGKFGFKA